jgi:hypothetical protein
MASRKFRIGSADYLVISLPSAVPKGKSDMNGKPWQCDKIFELRRLWKEGLTGSEIAQTLGMSRSAVIGKLNRLGLIGDMPESERLKRVNRTAGIALRRFWATMSPEERQTRARRLSNTARSWWRSASPQEQQARNAKAAVGYRRWWDSLTEQQRAAHNRKDQ